MTVSSFRSKVKKNVPKVALDSIWSLVVGSYKTGKTRLWKEVTELHYASPEEALLIAFEAGYETWELENLIPVHEEAKSEEDAWKVWEYFKKDVVKGLVQEAQENRVVKLIGIDTADRCIDAAASWILRDRTKKYGRPVSSLQELATVSGGDENGWNVLYDELKKAFDALRSAGYGIMALAWTKEKETTLYNGMKYNSVELMMNNTGRKVFESQASFIACLFNEVVVLDGTGKELEDNVKDKKGKERASNFHKTQVMMHFRPSEYISIAGGRYTDLPEESVAYSAENFMRVFEDAVKGQLKKTDKPIEQLREEENVAREEKVKEHVVEQQVAAVSATSLIAKIEKEVSKFTVDEQRQHLVSNFEKIMGISQYKKCEDASLLQEVLKFTEQKVVELKK